MGSAVNRARHDATLPFTRFLAGHADYTPVHFGKRRADTTWAHQTATAAVFTAPLLTFAAHPRNILDNPCLPMIKSVPATWDETIVLPVSEIGEVAAFARRNGNTWFFGHRQRTGKPNCADPVVVSRFGRVRPSDRSRSSDRSGGRYD